LTYNRWFAPPANFRNASGVTRSTLPRFVALGHLR